MSKCEKLGCKLYKIRYVSPTVFKDEGYYTCPRGDDAHELCLEIFLLEQKLKEANNRINILQSELSDLRKQ